MILDHDHAPGKTCDECELMNSLTCEEHPKYILDNCVECNELDLTDSAYEAAYDYAN